jgi:hypothetical protein
LSAPWLKFYPSDWRADPALRMCSIAARGLWMEMLCIMHEATPRGSLRINGRPVTDKQMAALAGVADVTRLLSEMEEAGVFSRSEDGTIYSRRMMRDEEKAAQDKANGKQGGNPTLKGGVNPQDKAQKPEARTKEEKIEPNGSLSETSSDAPASKTKIRNKYPEPFEEVWREYPTDQNMSKKEAFDAWKRLGDDDKEALSSSIPSFVAYCSAHPDYRPIHLCRYIVKRRFEGHGGQHAPTGNEFCAEDWPNTRILVARFKQEHQTDPPRAVNGGKAGYLIPAEWVAISKQQRAANA